MAGGAGSDDNQKRPDGVAAPSGLGSFSRK